MHLADDAIGTLPASETSYREISNKTEGRFVFGVVPSLWNVACVSAATLWRIVLCELYAMFPCATSRGAFPIHAWARSQRKRNYATWVFSCFIMDWQVSHTFLKEMHASLFSAPRMIIFSIHRDSVIGHAFATCMPLPWIVRYVAFYMFCCGFIIGSELIEAEWQCMRR